MALDHRAIDVVFGWLPEGIRRNERVVAVAHAFPGLGREFMPKLDEGSYLLMPVTQSRKNWRRVAERGSPGAVGSNGSSGFIG